MNTKEAEKSIQHINRLLGVLTVEVKKLNESSNVKEDVPVKTENRKRKFSSRTHLPKAEKVQIAKIMSEFSRISAKDVAKMYGISLPSVYSIRKQYKDEALASK